MTPAAHATFVRRLRDRLRDDPEALAAVTLAPGQAVGDLTERGDGVILQVIPGADGAVPWTATLDGTCTFPSLDVGLEGVAGWLAAGRFTVAACP